MIKKLKYEDFIITSEEIQNLRRETGLSLSQAKDFLCKQKQKEVIKHLVARIEELEERQIESFLKAIEEY